MRMTGSQGRLGWMEKRGSGREVVVGRGGEWWT